MAELDNKITTGILGDIKPVEAARDHMVGGDGNDEEQDDAAKPGAQHAGSREVSEGGGVGSEVSGTRNYHSTGGATGGDLGNRPE